MNAAHDPTTQLLEALQRSARKKAELLEQVSEVDAEIAQLIKDGFEAKIPGQALADAAGLSKPRVYQIRDDRR